MAEPRSNARRTPRWLIGVALALALAGLALLWFMCCGAISGSVLDATTLEAIPGATVAAGKRSAITDREGRFTLRNSHGVSQITASAPGFETRRAAAARLVDVMLAPTAEETARRWFEAWRQGDYASMYRLFAADCRRRITEDGFVAICRGEPMRIDAVQTHPAVRLVTDPDPQGRNLAEVPVSLQIEAEGGSETVESPVRLVREPQGWRIVWYRDDRRLHPAFRGARPVDDKKTGDDGR
jgi:hypothetical protein